MELIQLFFNCFWSFYMSNPPQKQFLCLLFSIFKMINFSTMPLIPIMLDFFCITDEPSNSFIYFDLMFCTCRTKLSFFNASDYHVKLYSWFHHKIGCTYCNQLPCIFCSLSNLNCSSSSSSRRYSNLELII